MKKKTLRSSKQLETVRVVSNETEATFDKINNQPADCLTVSSKSMKSEGVEKTPQEQIPLVQLTLSISQIEHDFKRVERQTKEEPLEYVSDKVSHFIGMGRSQQCQWTMVTAPLIGVVKRQGKIKMTF